MDSTGAAIGGIDLFRSAVIQEQRAKVLGRVVVRPPSLLFYATVISTLSLACAGSVIVFGAYAPRETATGFLVPEGGMVKVTAARPGKVDLLLVSEGESVAAGQTLALVSAEEALMDADGKSVLERILAELTAEEERLSAGLVREEEASSATADRSSSRIANLRREMEAASAEKAAVDQQIESARRVMQRIDELHKAGYVTEIEMAGRRQQILELERQGHALNKALANARSQLGDAELELKSQPLQSKQRRAELENRISDIKRRIAGYEIERGYALVAPISGRVTALQAESGKAVTPQQPVMAIVAEDAVMEAHLLLPSRAIGFIAEGQEVRLRYAAFPYQHYGVQQARVTEISRTTLRPEELAVGLPLTEPVYRVKAALDAQTVRARGKQHALQSGMLLEADILLEERPLWAWFLEPLLAFRGRV